MLTTSSATKLTYSIKQKWTDGAGEIADEDWGVILDSQAGIPQIIWQIYTNLYNSQGIPDATASSQILLI